MGAQTEYAWPIINDVYLKTYGGGRYGIRTCGPLIKSQLLYQLS